MVYIVVQWEGENSVSTVNERQVILGAEHALTEGLRIQVSTGGKTSNGRIAAYYTVVLKVFGK